MTLSFDALAVECRCRWRAPSETAARSSGDIAKVAVVLGVDHKRVYRWRSRGVTLDEAEDIGAILGVHPASIWMREWSTVAA